MRLLTGALAVALALPCCGGEINYSEYAYAGKIGEEYVAFGHHPSDLLNDPVNTLTVQKPDGRVIEYVDDRWNDLQIDRVRITVNGEAKEYAASNGIGKPVMEEAVKQFREYLSKIKQIKIEEGMKALK